MNCVLIETDDDGAAQFRRPAARATSIERLRLRALTDSDTSLEPHAATQAT